jgi:NADH:ubiquinone oxidoreductase subunit 4 (subunit M)
VTWKEGLYDLDKREKIMMIPLVLLAVVFGLFPHVLLDTFSIDLKELVGAILITK